MKTLILVPSLGEGDGLLHRFVHVARGGESVLGENLHGDLFVGPRQADHDRHLQRIGLGGGHDTVRDVVGAGDAAEDVEQDRLDVRIGRDDAERVDDLLRIRRAADIEEVRRLAAVVLHEVHRRHRETGAVHHAADVTVELDEGEVVYGKFPKPKNKSDQVTRFARALGGPSIPPYSVESNPADKSNKAEAAKNKGIIKKKEVELDEARRFTLTPAKDEQGRAGFIDPLTGKFIKTKAEIARAKQNIADAQQKRAEKKTAKKTAPEPAKTAPKAKEAEKPAAQETGWKVSQGRAGNTRAIMARLHDIKDQDIKQEVVKWLQADAKNELPNLKGKDLHNWAVDKFKPKKGISLAGSR